MSTLDQYNNFQDSIVLKVHLDGRVSIKDGPAGCAVQALARPDLILELDHTNHALHATRGWHRFRLTITNPDDLSGCIESLIPGRMLSEIRAEPASALLITPAGGRPCPLACHSVQIQVVK